MVSVLWSFISSLSGVCSYFPRNRVTHHVERPWPWLTTIIPGQAVLGGTRQQTGRLGRSKPVTKIPSWLLLPQVPALSSFSDCSQWWTLLGTCKLSKPFLPPVALHHDVLITVIGSKVLQKLAKGLWGIAMIDLTMLSFEGLWPFLELWSWKAA